jgi:RNA polymerase sigma-70 factor, ECF subfamily
LGVNKRLEVRSGKQGDHVLSGGMSEEEASAWVDMVLPRALAFARTLVIDIATAEDLVHDCVFRLWQRRASYDLKSDGLRLLFRSIANATVDRFRRAGRELSEEWISGESTKVTSTELEPSKSVLLAETQSIVAIAIKKLSVNQRIALTMSSQSCTLKEIAESLSVTEQNAGVIVHRARKAMEEMLAPYLKDGTLSGGIR